MSPVSLDIYTQSNTKIINFTMKGCRSFYKLTKQLWEKSISRLKLLSVLWGQYLQMENNIGTISSWLIFEAHYSYKFEDNCVIPKPQGHSKQNA